MSEITPTADHLNDPYVRQLIEALSKRDDHIEELEAQVEALQNKCARRGLSPEDSDALEAENERLQGRVKAYLNAMHTPHQEMVKRIEKLEAENAKLREELGRIALCYVEHEYSDFDVGINYCARQARKALSGDE